MPVSLTTQGLVELDANTSRTLPAGIKEDPKTQELRLASLDLRWLQADEWATAQHETEESEQ